MILKSTNKYKVIRAFIAILLITFAFSLQNANAQDRQKAKYESLIRLGDAQFNIDYFQKAEGFYLRAYKINKGEAHVNYQIAECKRLTYKYKESLDFYKTTAALDLENYPLSLFYYALALKYKGNYNQAIVEFEKFIKEAGDIAPKKFQNKKAFFDRALIEMEGCYWSIEQLFKYECINLKAPVNSPVNDFGAVILKNDTDLIILSERKKANSKSENKEGNNSTNPFYFSKTDNWNENKGFPLIKKIQTKYNEGSGVFNADKTKFYYTECGKTDDGFCEIFVTENKGKNWTKPNALNSEINLKGYDNKQPALSASGDTLYFVSDRPGGQGQGDIWMSTKQKGDKWSPPVNMGTDINTPFNEVTPFWYAPESALFFSSDGHKGFGGLDIFIAKKNKDGLFTVTNFSSPFNTNLDDIYFSLGEYTGYLVSNRLGGLGGFDIYTFSNMFVQRGYKNYKTKLAKLAEDVSKLKYDVQITQPEIPEALVDVDVQTIYDRIMSAKVAALLYDVRLTYFEPDYIDYQKLTIDDKSIIDMLYMSYEVDLDQAKIDSMKIADEAAYNALDIDTKNFTDRMATAYTDVSGGAEYAKISKDDFTFYANLKLINKQELDRIINFRINKIETEKRNNAEIYNSDLATTDVLNQEASPLDDRTYESIISTFMAGYIHNFHYQFILPDYKIYSKLDIADLSIIDMDYGSRAFKLSDAMLDSIRKEDEATYYALPPDEKNRIDKMANACLAMNPDSQFVNFSTINEQYLFNMKIGKKRMTDRLVAFSCVKSEFAAVAENTEEITDIFPNIDTTLVTHDVQEKYKKIVSNFTAGFIYNTRYPFAEPDQLIYSDFSEDDKGLVEALFMMQTKKYTKNVIQSVKAEDEANYNSLPVSEKKNIDKIALKISNSPYDSSYIELKENLFDFYNNLSLKKKQKTDRLIAYQINQLTNAKKEAVIKYVDILTDDLGVTEKNETGKLFTDVELDKIERILSFKMACYIHNINLPFIESDFIASQNLTIENASILDMMFASKIYALQDPVVVKAIRQSDAVQYKKLGKEDKGFIDIVAENFIFNDTANFITLNNSDTQKYKNFNIQEKYKNDRLLVYKLKKLYSPDPTISSTEEFLNRDILYVKEMSQEGKLISQEMYDNYDRILSVRIAATIHEVKMPFIKSDFDIYNTFTFDDKSIVEMMVDTKKVGLQNKLLADSLRTKDKKRYENLPTDDKNFVDRIVQEYLSVDNNGVSVEITPDDSQQYKLLKNKVKYRYDRLIAMRLHYFKEAKNVETKLEETLNKDELAIDEVIDNKVITEDVNFTFDRLIAFKLAAYIYDQKLPFPETDYNLANSLSLDDASIMDMMFLAKTIQFKNLSEIDSIKTADKISFTTLSDEQKELVSNLIKAYVTTPDSAEFVPLKKGVSKKYAKLSTSEKFKIDRVFISRLSVELENKAVIVEAEETIKNDELSADINELAEETQIVSKDDMVDYERVISFKVAKFIHNLSVPFISVDYEAYDKMSIDDKSILDLMYEARVNNIKDEDVKALLRKSDAQKYYYLEKKEKQFIDRIVDKYTEAGISEVFIELGQKDEQRYLALNTEEKNKTDRLVLFRLQTLIKSPDIFIKDNQDTLTQNLKEIASTTDIINNVDFKAYERILSMRIAGFIYGQEAMLIESDFRLENRLTIDDKSIIDLMYQSRTFQLNTQLLESMKKSDKMLYKSLSDTEKEFIKRLAVQYNKNRDAQFVSLQKDDAQQYRRLSILEKNRIDRLVLANFDIQFTENHDTTNNVKKRPAIVQNFEFSTGDCTEAQVSALVETPQTGAKVSSIKIELRENNEFVGATYTNTKGFFEFDQTQENSTYKFSIINENLVSEAVYFITGFKLKCEEKTVALVKTDTIKVASDKTIRPIENVFFGYNEVKITPDATVVLDRIITYYKTHDNCIMYLNAFTDNVGSDNYNMYLSKQRGKAVLNYMTTHGVNWKHIKIHAEGKENPSIPNSNSKQRKINRRVEIVVMGIN